MSTIGSDYSSAHRRSLEELEQEYESATRKMQEGEKMREAKLQKNLEAALRKKDSETESSVQNVKDEYQGSMSKLSKADRLERERYKQALYDRNGRHSSAVEEAARTDRDRALEAAAMAESRSSKSLSDSEKYLEERAAAADERHQKEKEALVESYRQQIREARGGSTEEERTSTNEYRKKLAEEAQAAIRQARDEVLAERRQAKALAEQTQFVLKDREKKSDHHLNSRLHEKNLSMSAELNKNAEAERASRAMELQPLRELVADTADVQRNAARAKNEARSGAIRELESDWNAKYANQALSHDLEKQKLKADNSDADRVYAQKLGNYKKENDSKTATMLANQNSEHRDQLTTTSQEYDRSLAQVKIQAEHDKKRSDELLERERVQGRTRQDRALANQADTYQTTIANQRKNQQSQIKNLERVLNDKNSTDDPGSISAAAEQSLRGTVSRHYDKTFKAEADRNLRDRDHLEANYRQRLSDAILDKQTNTTHLNRQNVKEQSTLRSEFVQHVTDVEENKRQMLNLAADANMKMSESTLRNNERQTAEMRRHYEELIATRDADQNNRYDELRSKSEFEKRSMRREFQAQNSDLIRSYQKQLADQKLAADEVVRDLKAKLDSKTRENDKRLMQVVADQARNTEHRIAALEAQSKDRERMASQLHEDELDKVKKANALLLSKKG